ncbi:MAG: diaminopimelate decarboxylase [Nitrospiraceae bacterium]|nr:diaminopimelate decarboxylase [Nitrospiraceae bacterium]
MHYFSYKGDDLHAEDVRFEELGREYGTPLYVYSKRTLLRHMRAYKKAFGGGGGIVSFALKANSNGAILRLLASEGAGADVVSGGELFRALKAGIPAGKTVYAGVGKTADEISYALKKNILMFNVESDEELEKINRVAGLAGRRAPVALRVNPDIDPMTHPYISTGLEKNKFGLPIKDALEFYVRALKMKNIEIIGVHEHIGSQLTELAPFREALEKVLTLIDRLRDSGIKLKYLDLGGGLGIRYDGEKPPGPGTLAKNLLPLLKDRGLTVIVEPGRSIAGNAGVLLTRCLYTKKTARKRFAIVDAGMNDLIRPALYGSYHEIIPVRRNRRARMKMDVVGPICESGDFLAADRFMPGVKAGELLCVLGAGAYGFSMSSNYNSRPHPAEVMVDGGRHWLIRKRGTYRDLIRSELVGSEL